MRAIIVEDSFYEDYKRILSFMEKMDYPQNYVENFKLETKHALANIEEHNEIAPLVDERFFESFRKYVYFNHLIFYIILDEKRLSVARLFHEKEGWQNEIV